jgi:hypothetical protein
VVIVELELRIEGSGHMAQSECWIGFQRLMSSVFEGKSGPSWKVLVMVTVLDLPCLDDFNDFLLFSLLLL